MLSRLRIASSRRDSSASWLAQVAAGPVHLAAHQAQPQVGGARLRGAGGRPSRPVPGGRRPGVVAPPSPCSSAPRSSARACQRDEVVEVGAPVAVAHGAQRVRGVRERLRGLRMQLVEPGARRFAPGTIHRAECSRAAATARAGPQRSARDARPIRRQPIRKTRTPGDGTRRRSGRPGPAARPPWKQAAAGSEPRPGSRATAPCVALATISHSRPELADLARSSDVRRRLVREREGRDALRLGQPDREVVDHRRASRPAAPRSPPSRRASTA